MSTLTAPRMLTLEEFAALPDDGVERELIRGEVRERAMTRRNRNHSKVEHRINKILGIWLDTQPEPGGEIVSGEAGFDLSRNPDSGVGIDVAYVSAEVAARNPDSAYYEGAPILAVEILSPSDTQKDIDDKVELYLETGVKVVWIVNPRFRTVTIHRPNEAPTFVNEHQVIENDPNLPGFRVEVEKFFR